MPIETIGQLITSTGQRTEVPRADNQSIAELETHLHTGQNGEKVGLLDGISKKIADLERHEKQVTQSLQNAKSDPNTIYVAQMQLLNLTTKVDICTKIVSKGTQSLSELTKIQ